MKTVSRVIYWVFLSDTRERPRLKTMKNKYGIFKRKIGQARKNVSIYTNLGHPYEIRNLIVIFIGKEQKAYSLTKNKEYKIIDTNSGKFNFDNNLWSKFKNKKNSDNVECSQTEDYFITILNDLGHKRRYSHLMFKLKESGEKQ